MAGFSPGLAPSYGSALYVGTDVALAVAAGILVSTPLVSHLSRFWERRTAAASTAARAFALDTAAALAEVSALVAVSVAAVATIAAGTYNPFIYFRF
jgi:alginate O-acetyltransferase complex protein AlgI